MTIELHRITIRELVEGYVADVEKGVRGYGGRLDIRPPYQREFVYREKERNAVVSTVMKGGKTVPENLQMLCRCCNAIKSDRFWLRQ